MTDQASKTDQANRSAVARRTRRQLLAGGTGAPAAALTAEALARPASASAGTDGDVVLGASNTETNQTSIANTTAGLPALSCQGAGDGTGVQASCSSGIGVHGISTDGDGVRGEAGSGNGVLGQSTSGAGVIAASSSGTGVSGQSNTSEGVYGQSGSTASGLVSPRNGVHGITDSSAGSGVLGENAGGGTGVTGIGGGTGASVVGTGGSGPGGAGVIGNGGTGGGDDVIGNGSGSGAGIAGSGGPNNGAGVVGSGPGTADGVRGTATSGNGVPGQATSAAGVGVLAENTTGGTALRVSGQAAFSRSGLLTVAAGKSSGTVTGVALTTASLVLATVQQNLSGVYVRAAVPNVPGRSFTINLSKAPSASAKVAWFVVN
jgi:hypothetical protein